MNADDFTRIVSPGTIPGAGRLFITVEYKDGRLSLTGVEGPLSNGNARGGCGQTGIDYSIGKRLAVEAAHIPWAVPPYAVFRLQDTKKVLSRPITGAEEFESFLLNLPKEDKP